MQFAYGLLRLSSSACNTTCECQAHPAQSHCHFSAVHPCCPRRACMLALCVASSCWTGPSVTCAVVSRSGWLSLLTSLLQTARSVNCSSVSCSCMPKGEQHMLNLKDQPAACYYTSRVLGGPHLQEPLCHLLACLGAPVLDALLHLSSLLLPPLGLFCQLLLISRQLLQHRSPLLQASCLVCQPCALWPSCQAGEWRDCQKLTATLLSAYRSPCCRQDLWRCVKGH